mmetsp:Transcript_39515/g.92849  ORF Transcript_39515/g.92849 Transcript_39515/m.92849 type:complete len:122 (+) Transcript_39515:1220-1585(+)
MALTHHLYSNPVKTIVANYFRTMLKTSRRELKNRTKEIYHTRLLHDGGEIELQQGDFDTYGSDDAQREVLMRATRARTRWLLAYTLLNNPSLCQLRKAVVTQSQSSKLEESSADASEFGQV